MILKQLFWWVPFGSVPEISPKELYAKLKNGEGPHMIDVRSPGEWRTSHIEGAVNVPVTSLKQALKNLKIPLERPVVTICLSAHRSIPAVRLLELVGYKDVRQLQGGMQAWWRDGLPVKENA